MVDCTIIVHLHAAVLNFITESNIFLPLFLRLGVFPGSPGTSVPKISPVAIDIVSADVHNWKKKKK